MTITTFNTISTIKKPRNKQYTSPTTKSKASNLPQQKSTKQLPINQLDHITRTSTRLKTTKLIPAQPQLQTTTQFHCLNDQGTNTSHHQLPHGNQHVPKIHLHQLASFLSLMPQTLDKHSILNRKNIKQNETCRTDLYEYYQVRSACQTSTNNVPRFPNVRTQ